MQKFKFNVDLTQEVYKNIPSYVITALEYYVSDRHSTGGFLNAVLTNDLFRAVGKADNESMKALRGIVTLIHCHVPAICWGSKERVRDWLNGVEA